MAFVLKRLDFLPALIVWSAVENRGKCKYIFKKKLKK